MNADRKAQLNAWEDLMGVAHQQPVTTQEQVGNPGSPYGLGSTQQQVGNPGSPYGLSDLVMTLEGFGEASPEANAKRAYDKRVEALKTAQSKKEAAKKAAKRAKAPEEQQAYMLRAMRWVKVELLANLLARTAGLLAILERALREATSKGQKQGAAVISQAISKMKQSENALQVLKQEQSASFALAEAQGSAPSPQATQSIIDAQQELRRVLVNANRLPPGWRELAKDPSQNQAFAPGQSPWVQGTGFDGLGGLWDSFTSAVTDVAKAVGKFATCNPISQTVAAGGAGVGAGSVTGAVGTAAGAAAAKSTLDLACGAFGTSAGSAVAASQAVTPPSGGWLPTLQPSPVMGQSLPGSSKPSFWDEYGTWIIVGGVAVLAIGGIAYYEYSKKRKSASVDGLSNGYGYDFDKDDGPELEIEEKRPRQITHEYSASTRSRLPESDKPKYALPPMEESAKLGSLPAALDSEA